MDEPSDEVVEAVRAYIAADRKYQMVLAAFMSKMVEEDAVRMLKELTAAIDRHRETLEWRR